MKINSNLSEIRAEVLLSHLYPEMEERWKVHHEGAFFRNYNGDSMSIDETTGEVRLSRDGFMRLLPQGVLTDDEELKGEDAAEKFKKKCGNLTTTTLQTNDETFKPIYKELLCYCVTVSPCHRVTLLLTDT